MAEEKTPRRAPHRWRVPEEAWDHAQAARDEWRKSWYALFPPAFIQRRRAARKEALLAVRSLIDAALDRIDKEE